MTTTRLRGGLTLVAVVAVALLVWTAVSPSPTSSATFQFRTATPLGTVVPVQDRRPPEDFSARLLGGQGIDFRSEIGGKVAMVNFWASWCGPCTAETPEFDAVYRQYRSQGIQFIGINTKDTRTGATSFVDENHISYPIVFDEQGAAVGPLGNVPANLPFTLMFDRQGRVAAVYLGIMTGKDLENSLDLLLHER